MTGTLIQPQLPGARQIVRARHKGDDGDEPRSWQSKFFRGGIWPRAPRSASPALVGVTCLRIRLNNRTSYSSSRLRT